MSGHWDLTPEPCVWKSNTPSTLLPSLLSWRLTAPLSFSYPPPPHLPTVPKLQMKFSVRNMCPVEGEANVARFLFRLLSPDPSDAGLATLVDSWVDTAFFQLAEGGAKEQAAALRSLNAALGRQPWLTGPELSLADIACYCCAVRSGATAAAVPTHVQRWMKACENLGYFSRAKLQ